MPSAGSLFLRPFLATAILLGGYAAVRMTDHQTRQLCESETVSLSTADQFNSPHPLRTSGLEGFMAELTSPCANLPQHGSFAAVEALAFSVHTQLEFVESSQHQLAVTANANLVVQHIRLQV